MNKKWKDKAWKIATVIIVAIIIINPEVAELALFIDAVGLEMFFTLIEMQIFITFGLFYSKIKMILGQIKDILKEKMAWRVYQKNPQYLLLVIPSQAVLMYLLVFSAMLDLVYKAY